MVVTVFQMTIGFVSGGRTCRDSRPERLAIAAAVAKPGDRAQQPLDNLVPVLLAWPNNGRAERAADRP